MSANTESPVNRLPNARAHNEDPAAAVPSAPLPGADHMHTSASERLPADADALSKTKQELATTPPPWESPATYSRYPWHNGKLSFADAPGERFWGGIGLSFVLLLPIALLLSLLDNGIATVVLLLSTNRRSIGAFTVVLLSILIVWNARRQLYTPLNGIMFALEGFHALCLAWDFVTRTYPDAAVDDHTVRIKREIDAAIASLEKQRSDLMRAGRWERLAMLHWGTAAVHAFDAQYWWMAFGIKVFELNAARQTRNSRRRRPLPPSVTAPPPRS